MRTLRTKLTYANVTATLAVFLALGGGAYAATRIHARDIASGAVRTRAIHARAVTSGKIAIGAVRGNQVARAGLSSTQIKPGSITPASLEVPLQYIASPGGGSVSVPSGEGVAYPLADATWTQGPGQINVVFGEGTATLAYDGSGEGSCRAFIELSLNGHQVGGGELSTSSETLVPVTGSLGANPEIDPPAPRTNTLTSKVFSNGDCVPASTIDSARFRVLDFG
jgi:hypothetical protein